MSVVHRLTAAFRDRDEQAHLLATRPSIQQLAAEEREGSLRMRSPETSLSIISHDDELLQLKDFSAAATDTSTFADPLYSRRVWLHGDGQTWQDWGISLWSEFLGTFLMVFVGMPPPPSPVLFLRSSFFCGRLRSAYFNPIPRAWDWVRDQVVVSGYEEQQKR
jgi:hypothetical protein